MGDFYKRLSYTNASTEATGIRICQQLDDAVLTATQSTDTLVHQISQ